MASIIRRGKGQFQARIRRKGYTTLVKTFTTRRDALLWAAHVESEMTREVFVAAQPECEKTTLTEALDRYSREVTPHKKGAAHELRRINAWKKHPLASCYLANIRGVDLAAYRDARIAQGRSGNTIRLELALISHLFEVARKDWGMETLANPVKAIRKPKLPRGRDRRLQPGEEAKLMDYCDKHDNWCLKAAIQLAIETAMRRGELTQLKWSDINLQTRLLYLADTKNGESRTVPLSTRAVATLEALPKNSDGLVLGFNKDWLPRSFNKLDNKVLVELLRLLAPLKIDGDAFGKVYEYFLGKFALKEGQKALQRLERQLAHAADRGVHRIVLRAIGRGLLAGLRFLVDDDGQDVAHVAGAPVLEQGPVRRRLIDRTIAGGRGGPGLGPRGGGRVDDRGRRRAASCQANHQAHYADSNEGLHRSPHSCVRRWSIWSDVEIALLLIS